MAHWQTKRNREGKRAHWECKCNFNRACSMTFYYCGNKIILNFFLDLDCCWSTLQRKRWSRRTRIWGSAYHHREDSSSRLAFFICFNFCKATRNSEFYLFWWFLKKRKKIVIRTNVIRCAYFQGLLYSLICLQISIVQGLSQAKIPFKKAW